MMRHLLLLLCLIATPTFAEDRFWILWERYHRVGPNCPNGASCLTKREFSSRPLPMDYSSEIYRLFGVMDPRGFGTAKGRNDPNAPAVCSAQDAELSVGFDPLAVPQSLKIEALRGITALHVDLTRLKPAPGHPDEFGQRVHNAFVAKLTAAGLRVVDRDTVKTIPGQPTLNIFFSFNEPHGDCHYEYSVFASLTQDVMLARDIRIKINAGVWAFSTGSKDTTHNGDERAAILRVADALIRDHRQVNPR
ncbi:hypothetical protein [Thalassobius sp. Cn5-15]|uniref:hypothetical protein n=1 Tax=Thalassobius sp. Cn5-15 TaxID=2917763 RepID=UPI001EF3008B|nr:hypothetical protein [Thalassobius sp. Cn5-15]MCG7494629.1 hypothetical protein [Thalassobius sp. Cn5-15]